MGTVTWNNTIRENEINELDNELNKLIYGETPTNVNSDESFESEESSEEISENEVIEAEDNKSLNSNELRTESGRKIEEAAPSEMLVKPDGSKTFGVIDERASKAIGVPEGNIQIDVKCIRHTAWDNHGEQIKNAGYSSVEEFFIDVLSNYEKIYEGKHGSLLLVKKLEKNSGISAIELEHETKGFYLAQTGWIIRDRGLKNKKLLFTRSESLATSPATDEFLRTDPIITGGTVPNAQLKSYADSLPHGSEYNNAEDFTTENNEINEPENIEPQNSNENPVASGEGNGSSEATHSEPMLTRPEEGAGISDKILTSNGEIINARTSWPKNSSSVDTQSLVEFFNTANESSGFHELAHHVLRVLTDAVQLENSSDLLVEDVNKIFKNAGVKYDDFVNNIGNSREIAHEYFAKSFEAYLFEGKAPVQELQSTFDRIKQWLVEIYHDIQKISGIELNDEMRDIFDRLLASPEQAAEQKNISEINSLYEAGENELQKLQELINQLEEQLRISNEQWEEIADQAFIKGKNKGEDYGIKEGRNYQKEIDKKKNKEKNNLRIEKLKQNFKLIQERQKERRNIREKYKKLVKEINRMSEAKNIHWNRLQQIKNLLSTYDNLNQKNYSLKEMQDIHSAVSSNSGKI